MIKIRLAEATDFEKLMELYSILYGKTMLEKSDESVRLWNRIITDSNYNIIVAEENGMLVSTCTCVIVPNMTYDRRPYAIIENIVTHSEYRAQGLASACLEEAKNIAEDAGCFRMILTTASKLKSTHRFYERLGYNTEDMTVFTQWL